MGRAARAGTNIGDWNGVFGVDAVIADIFKHVLDEHGALSNIATSSPG